MSAPPLLPTLLRQLKPAPLPIDRRERWRVALGVAAGLLLAAGLSRLLQGAAPTGAAWPWLVAPLGASAVLVFGLPSSPLAQPYAVVAGNTVSALVGVAAVLATRALAVPEAAGLLPVLAVATGASLAVAAMLALRCLHPPGGAVALVAVLGAQGDWRFALFPVLVNSLLLVLAGTAYNRATGKAYPHAAVAPATPAAAPLAGGTPRFADQDIDRVLARRNELLDLPRDELQALLEAAETESHRRRLGALRCADIMSGEVVTVEYGTALQEAWTLLRTHKVKALPVVDRWRHVVGIVTLADFMRHADLDLHRGFDDRLRQLLAPSPGSHSDKAETVGQIMTRKVRITRPERTLAELVPILSSTGHHHIPVVDGEDRLVGILTQTDLVRALVAESAPVDEAERAPQPPAG